MRDLIKDERGIASNFMSFFLCCCMLLFFIFSIDMNQAFLVRHKTSGTCDAGCLAGVSMAQMEQDVTVNNGLAQWADISTWSPEKTETLVLDRTKAVAEATRIMNANCEINGLAANGTKIQTQDIKFFVAQDRKNWKDISAGKDSFTRGNRQAFFEMRIPVDMQAMFGARFLGNNSHMTIVYNSDTYIQR